MARKKEKNEIFYEELGARLRLLREERGFSLDQLSARIAGNGCVVSANMLGKIERGESRIQTHMLFALADFYQTDLSFFSSKPPAQHPLQKLTQSSVGRDCLVELASLSDDPRLLEFTLDFTRIVNFRIRKHLKNNEIILKASSPSEEK